MTLAAPSRRPAVATRRVGYVVAVLVNVVLLYMVNVWPGWEAVPFLTGETRLVIGLVNASIVVNLAVNLVYLVRDPPWLKALGDVVTAAVGLAAAIRILKVFPFDFGGSTFDWDLVVRILLVLGIVGCVIGIIAGFASFVRALSARHDREVQRL